jgi:hypothetical protein
MQIAIDRAGIFDRTISIGRLVISCHILFYI